MTARKKISVPALVERKSSAQKITALTAYDYLMAKLLDEAGIDMILVGDSLGTVVQGFPTTIPVTLEQMVYHCQCVSRAVTHALVVGDMPFMTYQVSAKEAVRAAGKLIKDGAVSAVKLEGGVHVAKVIERIVQVDIPVVGHIGLTPQSYHRMGGHKIQGRRNKASNAAGSYERVMEDARAVEAAGAFAVVIEGVPADLATEITAELKIPTIGIGAGNGCDGQILVTHDMLGLLGKESPRFVKHYAELAEAVTTAVSGYISEVQSGVFPGEAHTFREESPKPRKLKIV